MAMHYITGDENNLKAATFDMFKVTVIIIIIIVIITKKNVINVPCSLKTSREKSNEQLKSDVFSRRLKTRWIYSPTCGSKEKQYIHMLRYGGTEKCI